jgi:hypothetical protein
MPTAADMPASWPYGVVLMRRSGAIMTGSPRVC